MRCSPVLALAITTAFVSCRTTEVQTGASPQPSASVQPANPITSVTTVPIGATMQVSLNQAIGTKASKVGDRFYATVTEPLLTTYSEVVVPEGATVSGTITALDDTDRPGDQALIRLKFDRISWGARIYRFTADIVSATVPVEGEKRASSIKAAVASAAVGAVLSDAEASKVMPGTGSGSVVSLGMGDVEPALPVGSRMVVRVNKEIVLQP